MAKPASNGRRRPINISFRNLTRGQKMNKIKEVYYKYYKYIQWIFILAQILLTAFCIGIVTGDNPSIKLYGWGGILIIVGINLFEIWLMRDFLKQLWGFINYKVDNIIIEQKKTEKEYYLQKSKEFKEKAKKV